MLSKRISRLYKICTDTCAEGGEELLQLEGKLELSVHFCMLVWRHFVRNRCLVRASALAYTTLLAIIPLLAVVISVSSSLLKNQDEDKFYQMIASIAPPAADVSSGHGHFHSRDKFNPDDATATTTNPIANFAGGGPIQSNVVVGISNAVAAVTLGSTNFSSSALASEGETNSVAGAGGQVNAQKEVARWLRQFVQNTQGATLGVTGLVVFAFIAIMMLSRIEETFNDIWGVTRGRNWLTRIILYWGVITLGPTMLLGAISLSGSSHLMPVKHLFQSIPLGGTVLDLLPLLLLWVTFMIAYIIVPNTKVDLSAAAIGGVVAGTAWHVNNVFGFLYVSRVVMNSRIYGSIGLIPVFMLGLYFSWAILLFGAQVAYSYQNRAAYLQDKIADNVNQRGREFVALRIMTLLGQRFQHGLHPASVLQLSSELSVPSRLTQQVLRVLNQARLVTEVGRSEAAYVPARPIETINVHHILLALRTGICHELPVNETPELAGIYGEFARIEDAERNASEKISLLALVQRTPMVTTLPAPEAARPARELITIPQIETIHLPLGHDEFEDAPDPFLGTEAEKASAFAGHAVASMTPHAAPLPESTQPLETSTSPGLALAVPEKIARRDVIQPEERDFPL